tara:strand:+ start:493 stop:708 length:216 start_codon:yes stop_codon:yes gene_type:complete
MVRTVYSDFPNNKNTPIGFWNLLLNQGNQKERRKKYGQRNNTFIYSSPYTNFSSITVLHSQILRKANILKN